MFSISDERLEIIKYLQNEEYPKRPGEIIKALGKNPNTVRVTLRKMVKNDQLFQPGYGLYTTIN